MMRCQSSVRGVAVFHFAELSFIQPHIRVVRGIFRKRTVIELIATRKRQKTKRTTIKEPVAMASMKS